MSKQVQIQPSNAAGQVSKEQKRFNNYVQRIQKLRNEIEQIKTVDLELRQEGEKKIVPAERKSTIAFRDLLMALDASPHVADLTKNQREKFDAIMTEEAGGLLKTIFFSEDETIKAIYDKYSDYEAGWDELIQEEEDEMKEMASHFMNNMFGMDMNADDFADPAKMKEKMDARQA